MPPVGQKPKTKTSTKEKTNPASNGSAPTESSKTTKSAQAKKPVPEKLTESPKVSERPILHERYVVKIHCLPANGFDYDGPITAAMAKKLLKWESEPEYTARLLEKNPGTKEGRWKFGDNYLLKVRDQKIRCWNNAKNRPFDEKHAREIAQDILTLSWKMNGEDIIIGRTGLVLSGQHRLIGLILAVDEWDATKLKGAKSHWEENWPEEPIIESVIFYGAHEDPETLRTYDNVKSRTLSDTIYTSPLFDNVKDQKDKAECCRMMDYAVDCLFKRSKQIEGKSSWVRYQTHSTSIDFLDKHPKLKACVKHIFDNNRNRVISKLGLSAGQSAAMMYLMGCSATDSEDYHYPGSPKSEKLLNWDNWDKALEFWSGIADPDNAKLEPVRKALQNLRDPNTGATVQEKVKQMVLAKGWNEFVNENPIAAIDLDLAPHLKWSDTKERTLIVEEPTVGGIDVGIVKGGGEKEDEIATPEEIEAEEKRLAEERAAELDAIAKKAREKATKAPPKPTDPPFSKEEREAELAKVKVKDKKPPARPTLKPKG